MKKIMMMLLCGFLFSLAGHAQGEYVPPFAKNKVYAAASLSGLNFKYNSSDNWHADFNARGGWLFADNWMVLGDMGYNYLHGGHNTLQAGGGLRYYIEQNGLYIGVGATYVHNGHFDDMMPGAHLGYAFFLNRYVTVEPEIYYNQKLKSPSDYSGFGFRLGVGIYLF
jgi:hypothetical protein